MLFLHLLRSNATFSSTRSRSLFTISFLVFLGLPTNLFPQHFHSYTNFNTSLCFPSHMTKPLQSFLSQFIFIIFKPHHFATSSLEILSCHLTLTMYLNMILLSQLFKIFSNFPVNAYVSAPYNITDLTQLT